MESRIASTQILIFGGVLVLIVAVVGISAFGAHQRALAAEQEYVAAQLENESCLTEWGVNEGAATQRVSVTGVTADGLRVAVRLPYAYTVADENGELIFADTSSNAVYAVTFTETRRIRGDTISIC